MRHRTVVLTRACVLFADAQQQQRQLPCWLQCVPTLDVVGLPGLCQHQQVVQRKQEFKVGARPFAHLLARPPSCPPCMTQHSRLYRVDGKVSTCSMHLSEVYRE